MKKNSARKLNRAANGLLTVALEDLVTLFATELVRHCDKQAHLTLRGTSTIARTRWDRTLCRNTYVPFLRMSYAQRRKLVETVLDRII